jgi:hypothetical protein
MLQQPGSPLTAASQRCPALGDLGGLWQRTLLASPDGARDTTSTVRWLQGHRAFIDLRQPGHLRRSAAAGEPDPATPRCLEQLSLAQCLQLARQEGFAGQLSFDGAHFEWRRVIDFQPPARHADAGALRWDGEVLIETGRDVNYLEHWERELTTPAHPCCALELWDPGHQIRASWLRVGPFFMFARDRPLRLAGPDSLEKALAAAPTLEHARELVDCEISFGSVHRARFIIRASTLPWRVGDTLSPQLQDGRLTATDRAPDGIAMVRTWEVTAIEGELDALEAG